MNKDREFFKKQKQDMKVKIQEEKLKRDAML